MIYDLDKILVAAKEGEVIKLARGLYRTMGVTDEQAQQFKGPVLKRGVKLIGDGPGTRIECIRDANGPEVSVLFGGAGMNFIEGLDVDCGEPGRENKRNGIYLQEGGNHVAGVSVYRPWGNLAKRRESFGISMRSFQMAENEMVHCAVRDIQGDYQTAIQGHQIQRCEVEFPRSPANPRGFRVSYNVGDSDGAGIVECTAHWAEVGVYWDWMDCRNLVVQRCLFHGCEIGLHLNARQIETDTVSRRAAGIEFNDNDIVLDPRAPQVAAFAFVHSTPEGIYRRDNTLHSIRQVICQRNRIAFAPGQIVTPARARYGMNVSSFLAPSSRSPELGITEVQLVDTELADGVELEWRNFGLNADVKATITKVIEWTPE